MTPAERKIAADIVGACRKHDDHLKLDEGGSLIIVGWLPQNVLAEVRVNRELLITFLKGKPEGSVQ